MANNITPRQAPGRVQPFVTLNPAPVIAKRAPTTTDFYEPSTIWIQQTDTDAVPVNRIWILASVQSGEAVWQEVETSGGDGNFDNIFLPETDAGGTVGVVYVNGDRFISNYPNNNDIFIGRDSGNFALTGNSNVGIGSTSLQDLTTGTGNVSVGMLSSPNLTTGSFNSVLGAGSLVLATTADSNTVLGNTALVNVVTGDNNIAIGDNAGNSLTLADSDNINIGNSGTVGDNGIINIGTSGVQTETNLVGDVFVEDALLADAVVVQDDAGAGIASTLTLTNVVDTTQGAGTLSLVSANGNNGDNTGFLKVYVGVTPVWIPYFDDITP